nr:MAG TPA: hypothetical protein [Caudoviricetes sp.]
MELFFCHFRNEFYECVLFPLHDFPPFFHKFRVHFLVTIRPCIDYRLGVNYK